MNPRDEGKNIQEERQQKEQEERNKDEKNDSKKKKKKNTPSLAFRFYVSTSHASISAVDSVHRCPKAVFT